MLDYLIIGGGITGVTLGRLLQKKGINNFLIIEKESEAGGLCKTKKINNHYLDTGGGHFLCSKHQEVYDFIFSHIPESEFNYFERISKIRLENNIIDYPIESNLWQLPEKQLVKFLLSAIRSGESLGGKEPDNYEQWCVWKLGTEISDKYMIPYNRKIWGVLPSEMDIDWLYKIPKINTEEILLSSLLKFSDKEKMPSHQGFYYPKSGGFQRIFDSIYAYVRENTILNEDITSIEYLGDHWLINNTYEVKKIINTSPWQSIANAFIGFDDLKEDIFNLKASSIVVSLWEREYLHNWHWLYEPSLEIENHREFYIHNFAPYSDKSGIYTETNEKRWPGKGNPWKCGESPIYEHINKYAYPIPTIRRNQHIHSILNHLRGKNFFGVGRWGEWEYYNSDICILKAIEFVNNIE
ncbi:MAG TPA: NAD(P)-binding protein [Candidatus Paceibacterota bacterium]